jgi:hypothetical protein
LSTLCWLQTVREITAVARCDLRLGSVVRWGRGSSEGGWGVRTHANARTNGITVGGNKTLRQAKSVREVRNNTHSAWVDNRRKWRAAWWILEAKKRRGERWNVSASLDIGSEFKCKMRERERLSHGFATARLQRGRARGGGWQHTLSCLQKVHQSSAVAPAVLWWRGRTWVVVG